jgi:hypothetical protein
MEISQLGLQRIKSFEWSWIQGQGNI